ncbi:hypothetical protein B0H16DRAFT_1687551 [Mycena metata]|uniref:Uncharacterized protein n=1 Tax=Mycena metata TaxID=1033252 RepID=A0AAD7JL38_9AGAR|nr:hypothetical protein B0H16DRAFT_1687551 [Mycena metata]
MSPIFEPPANAPHLDKFVVWLSDARDDILPVSTWHLSYDGKAVFVEIPIPSGLFPTEYRVCLQNTSAPMEALSGIFNDEGFRAAFHTFHSYDPFPQHIVFRPQTLDSHFMAQPFFVAGDKVRVHILDDLTGGMDPGPDERLGRSPTCTFVINFIEGDLPSASALEKALAKMTGELELLQQCLAHAHPNPNPRGEGSSQSRVLPKKGLPTFRKQ